MKAKLLKKVRKRFEIIHMPNGLSMSGNIYKYNLFELRDLNNEYYGRYAQCGFAKNEKQFVEKDRIFETEKECIDFLKSKIIYILRNEGHRGAKDKRTNQTHKKVWYNK